MEPVAVMLLFWVMAVSLFLLVVLAMRWDHDDDEEGDDD